MGIFDTKAGVFTTYRAELKFRDKLMGGTPKDPKIIEGWLRSKAGIQDTEEVREAMLRTLIELGADNISSQSSFDELVEASQALAAQKQTNGFKVCPDGGLYIESRQVKAMLKEATNILYAGERWGRTKKGPKSYLAERVFVNPDKIMLGAPQASGIDLFIGHTTGPKGPQSNLTYIEYVSQPTLTFDVMVAEDAIGHKHWPQLWVLAQENGLGALRSQGFGRFDIVLWERIK